MECLSKIQEAVPVNYERYMEPEGDYWLSDYIKGLGFEVSPSSIEITPFELKMDKNEPADTDIDNAKILYRALNISSELASNGAFWTLLSHRYLHYMKYRAKLDEKTKDEAIAKITREFTFTETISKRNRRESIFPRLWWIAHMSFDAKRTGREFELTETMLSNQDLANNILDRTIFMNKVVTHTVLDYYKERITAGNPLSRKENRDLLTFLNAYGEIVVFESLSSKNIRLKIGEFESWYSTRNPTE